jgi:sulfite exporter TauE/SafE
MIKHKHYHSHLFTREHGKTIFTGLIHGLAGSGTLIVLMASLTPNFISSLLFLFLFGTGLILGMSIFSYSLGKIKFIKEDTFKKVIGSISLLYGLYFLTNLF